jgi:EamA-like transporter family
MRRTGPRGAASRRSPPACRACARTLTAGQPPGDIGQWITDLAAAHRTFAERLADRQSLTIPAEDPVTVTWARPSRPGPRPARDAIFISDSGLALGYLIVLGSLLGYSTYEWLLHHASSQLAGTYAFVSPLVAVILGWWLLGEQISAHTLLAAAGVALIMLHPRKPEPGQDETGD